MTISITSTTDNAEAVTAAMGDLAQTKEVEGAKEVQTEMKLESEAGEKEAELEEEAETSEELEEETELEELELKETESDDKKPKKKGGFQKKLEKAEKLRASLEQEKDYWRNEALRTKTETKALVEEVKPDLSKRPKADDFKSHDDYVEALTDWKLDQKLLAKEIKQKEDAVKSEVQTKIGKHQERVKEFSKSHDDWDDVIEAVGTAPLSLTVQEAIINSDSGPALMYELAKDPKELKRICALTPIQAAMALGKIEARVSKSDSSKEEILTTKAPPPIKPVRSKGTVTDSGYRDDMSLSAFDKWRKSERAKRAGA